MTLKSRETDQAGTSGAVFDSASFDTNAFDINSWDFGELIQQPAGNAGSIWINQQREEDDIMVIINTFLHMRQ